MKLTETFIMGDGTVTREYEGWTIDDIKAMRALAQPRTDSSIVTNIFNTPLSKADVAKAFRISPSIKKVMRASR